MYYLFIVYCTVYSIKLLNTIDCAIHKQAIMLRHCSTATDYPMLPWRQDAVFGMIMEHEERHRYTISFFSVQRKSTAVVML